MVEGFIVGSSQFIEKLDTEDEKSTLPEVSFVKTENVITRQYL